MENKIKFFIIPLVITFLLLPSFASADIFGIMDLFESQLSAVEEFTGVPMNNWVKVFILYVGGLIAFVTSGSLLAWVIRLPLTNPELISLSNNFVTSGWTFVSGLVNMGIILILLMIAFAYILKIETFRAKQVFVKLIIVALLVNFSLVFVKAIFDISNILYIYILNMVGPNFVWESFKTFAGGIKGVITAIAGSILVLTAPLMIPPAAPWVQFGVLIAWLTGSLFFIPTWIMQMVIAFLFSFLFILLFFLFSVRIFIIWIFAVLSPLAVVCWVLPQTKKFWDQWLKWLLDWMFFGVVILFLIALGLKTIPSIETPSFVWIGGLLPVPGWFFYYFFLFIYLLVIVYLLRKKFMPEFAEFLIEQSKAVGGMIWTRGLKPTSGVALKAAEDAAVRQKETEKKAKEEKRMLTTREKFGGILAKPLRWAYKTVGTTPEQVALSREVHEIASAEKILDPALLVSKINSTLRSGQDTLAAALTSLAIEKGDAFKKEVNREIPVERGIRMGAAANRAGATKNAKIIARSFVTEENLKNYPDLMKRMGFKEKGDLTDKEKKEWEAKHYETALQKLIEESKGNEIKNFAEDFWKSPEAMDAVQNFWGGSQISRAADEFGRVFVDDYMKVVGETEPEEFIRKNKRAALYLSGNAAQDAGFRPPGNWERIKIRKTISETEKGEREGKTDDIDDEAKRIARKWRKGE